MYNNSNNQRKPRVSILLASFKFLPVQIITWSPCQNHNLVSLIALAWISIPRKIPAWCSML